DTYASWLVLQAFRLQRGNPALSYHEMKAALGEPKSAVPEDRETSLSGAGWWLRSVVGTQDAGVKVLGSAFESVVHGRNVEARRQSAEFTEFDGYVPDAGPKLDPCAPDTVYSVTELERAAECP